MNTKPVFPTIELRESHAIFTIPENGRIVTKQFRPETLAKIISQDLNLDTGILPPNTLRYTCNKFGTFIGIFSPSCVRRVKYDTHAENKEISEFTCPVPHSLFILQFNKTDQFQYAYVYAFKTNIVTKDTEIFRFPFGNVHQDGKICTGNSIENTKITPINCGSFIETFYNSPFNSDLDGNMTGTTETGKNTIEYFRIYDKQLIFPIKILRKNNMKLEDLWQKTAKNPY